MDMSELRSIMPSYEVPGDHAEDIYILPVSGGADSSWLAIVLHCIAPHIHWRMVFTDTGAEEVETLQALDRLEDFLGRPIERVQDGPGLYDLLETSYRNFLPSPSNRWCTRVLKLLPFQKWLQQFAGKTKWVVVGIRADESHRLAFTIEEASTEMPFLDMGIRRVDVYRGLSQTVGIPRSYGTRTRSGCTCCPYQRSSEKVGLLQRSPAEFQRAGQFEKLRGVDADRHQEGVPLWRDTGSSANWLSIPLPDSDKDLRGRLKESRMEDLWGRRIFVGAEFFMDGYAFGSEFIWHQRVVCFSTTVAGLKQQMDGRYQHLLQTSEVYGMEPDDVRRNAKFAIYMIELPSDVFDPDGPRDQDSYTWEAGSSYRQIQHVVTWATRALHAENMRREAAVEPVDACSVEYEWWETAGEKLGQATFPLGSVLLSQWYEPSEVVPEPETEEEELRQTPCPMCSL